MKQATSIILAGGQASCKMLDESAAIGGEQCPLQREDFPMRCAAIAMVLVIFTPWLMAGEPLGAVAPQAISAVDISPDGKIITVGTMAFSHDDNVWQLGPDGTVLKHGRLPPFAPVQVATLDGGKTLAVGLAYSRVTSPEPTVWVGPTEALLQGNPQDEWAAADSRDSQLARWRSGSGSWREGWLNSQLGELFVSGPDWVFQPPTTFVSANGQRTKLRYEDRNLLPTSRATRMAASGDGRRAAFGWLTLCEAESTITQAREALSVYQTQPNRLLWTSPGSKDLAAPPLPDPASEYPELAREFRLAPDAVRAGSLVTGLAVNRDGSRIALVEHAVWCSFRKGPVIGNWDPPIHVLNFVPRQNGRLRVLDGEGRELFRQMLPEAGQFEIGFGAGGEECWCWPAAWFARGYGGAVWAPVDPPSKSLLHIDIAGKRIAPVTMPDTIYHAAVNPSDNRLLVSGREGELWLGIAADVKRIAQLKSPARVVWSRDGSFGIAGTADGRIVRLDADGKIAWEKRLPTRPVLLGPTLPAQVVPDLPVYQGGRLAGGEHAYVGDIWIVRQGDEAVLVDCGGISGVATTLERVRVLGIRRVTHILHTHSHGDHCGGAYLWQALGTRIVAPRSAELALTWYMPMLTDYGIFPPRTVDDPLPLRKLGDEADFTAGGQKFHAVFAAGHSFDLTIYLTELGGKRIAFTGDLGFENQDILHRCWNDPEKARAVLSVVREKVLTWKPDIVFTGHGVREKGMEFLGNLVEHTEASLRARGK